MAEPDDAHPGAVDCRVAQSVYNVVSDNQVRHTPHVFVPPRATSEAAGAPIDWERAATAFNSHLMNQPPPSVQLDGSQLKRLWMALAAPNADPEVQEAFMADEGAGEALLNLPDLVFRPVGPLKGTSLDRQCLERGLVMTDDELEADGSHSAERPPEGPRISPCDLPPPVRPCEPPLGIRDGIRMLELAVSHGQGFPAAFQLLHGYRGSDRLVRAHFHRFLASVASGDFCTPRAADREVVLAFNQFCERQPSFGFRPLPAPEPRGSDEEMKD